MKRMRSRPAVTDLHERRSRRVSRAMAARRALDRAPFPHDERDDRRAGGRVWVNGVEMGGTDARHAPLALSYD
jgi:hypothetical protein